MVRILRGRRVRRGGVHLGGRLDVHNLDGCLRRRVPGWRRLRQCKRRQRRRPYPWLPSGASALALAATAVEVQRALV